MLLQKRRMLPHERLVRGAQIDVLLLDVLKQLLKIARTILQMKFVSFVKSMRDGVLEFFLEMHG